MNPQQARERVAETFPQPFNKGKFLEFSRNLLNKFDESKAAQWNATYVKDAFKPHVSRFERLGTYTSPDDEKLDVLVVHLTNESKLERARTAIRNFVADHLKTRDEKDAALVAFVSPTEQQWRFSYVKMEYAAVETEAGRVGVETRLTPARRYSYIVGEGESCHTAQTRFLALLQDTENYPALAQLEEAFSVEAVTWEFFNQYAALFGEIEAGRYCSADITLVILKDEFRGKFKTKYLLALLNSRLLDYHFKSYAKLMDYRYEYYPKPVSLLRIKQASEPEQKRFVALVDRILAAKQRDAEADTSALEREIDELVYALYGLTPEEKALVQAAAK